MGKLLCLLLFLVLPSIAEARGGGSTSPTCTASPPSQASAVGFTNLVFCETFATNQHVDISNTRHAGFNFYYPLYSTDTPPPASHNLNDGTGYYVNDNETSTTSASGNANNTSYTGIVFGGGFYAEVSMKWNGSGCANTWPVFWFQSYYNQIHGPAFTFFPAHEIDVFEFVHCGAPLTNLYEFTGTGGAGYGNSNNGPSMGTPDYTQYHTYGVLWVTQAQAGGAGYVKWYFDNTLKETQTYQSGIAPNPSTCRGPTSAYSGSTTCPNGTFSGMDNEFFDLVLNGVLPFDTNNWAIYKNVHVWQTR